MEAGGIRQQHSVRSEAVLVPDAVVNIVIGLKGTARVFHELFMFYEFVDGRVL